VNPLKSREHVALDKGFSLASNSGHGREKHKRKERLKGASNAGTEQILTRNPEREVKGVERGTQRLAIVSGKI